MNENLKLIFLKIRTGITLKTVNTGEKIKHKITQKLINIKSNKIDKGRPKYRNNIQNYQVFVLNILK